MKPVMNLSEVELQPRPDAFVATGNAIDRFDAEMGSVAADYVEYPDSGKFAVTADRGGNRGRFMHVGREGESLDYWEGE